MIFLMFAKEQLETETSSVAMANIKHDVFYRAYCVCSQHFFA